MSAMSNANDLLKRFNEEYKIESSAQVEKNNTEQPTVVRTSSTVKKTNIHTEILDEKYLMKQSAPMEKQDNQQLTVVDIPSPIKITTKRAENWEEKYRPKIFSEIILPNNMAKYFAYVISNNEKPNIGLFSKTPGVGKSSLVKVLENELYLDLKSVNASNTRGIDFIRSDVMKFATTRTWEGGRKYVAFEESDQLTSDAQKLLKTEIERLNGHCQFIFTANDKSKLDEAVLSRLVVFDLDEEFENDQTNVMNQMVNRLLHITTLESCSIEKSVIESTVIEHYPSMRNMTLHLAKYCRINC